MSTLPTLRENSNVRYANPKEFYVFGCEAPTSELSSKNFWKT